MRLRAAILPALVLLLLTSPGLAAAQQDQPQTVVAVHLKFPYLLLRSVGVLKAEATVPLGLEYDFKTLVSERLAAVVAEDTRSRWRAATPQDFVDVTALWDDKTRPAKRLPFKTGRLLLVEVYEYGAEAGIPRDVFFIRADLKLVDCASSKTLWKGRVWQSESLKEKKIRDLKTDHEALKEGLNLVLEKFCREAKAKMFATKIE